MAEEKVGCIVTHPDGVTRHGVPDGKQGEIIELPQTLAESWDGRKVKILGEDREGPDYETTEAPPPDESEESPPPDEDESEEPDETTASDQPAEGEDSVEADSGNGQGEETSGEYPKHKGGGYYELSDGETVRGEEKAIEEQAKLEESE